MSYFLVLENEVKHGLMSGRDGSSLVFERAITDLSNYAGEKAAAGFAETEWNDIEEKQQLCTESKQLLDSMKVRSLNRWNEFTSYVCLTSQHIAGNLKLNRSISKLPIHRCILLA